MCQYIGIPKIFGVAAQKYFLIGFESFSGNDWRRIFLKICSDQSMAKGGSLRGDKPISRIGQRS